jgi:hypothetical protein
MSLTIFLAICILGMDFMIFVLFKWLYGEKKRKRLRRSARRTHSAGSQPPVHYVYGSGKSQTRTDRASLRVIPGRPRIVNKTSTAVPHIERQVEQNDSGKYPSVASHLARRRA